MYKIVNISENPIPAQAVNKPHFILNAMGGLSDLTSFFKLIRFLRATYPAIRGGIPYSQQKQSAQIASTNATLRSTRASQIFLIIEDFDIGTNVCS